MVIPLHGLDLFMNLISYLNNDPYLFKVKRKVALCGFSLVD